MTKEEKLKEYHKNYSKKWADANRERVRILARAWHHRNKDRVKNKDLKRLYGITREEYEQMLINQSGLCGVCTKPLPPGTGAHVDHCHKTGKVRSLLCKQCNSGLGDFRDDPLLLRAALAYIEAHN